MKNILLSLPFLLISFLCSAQKSGVLMDPVEIEEKVHRELSQSFLQSKDFVALKSKFPDVKGNMSLLVTVAGKGQVQTVFKSDGDITNVAFSNKLQDLLKEYRFGFALKKGSSCKVMHEFTF